MTYSDKKGRAVRVNITMDPRLLARIDALADARGQSRSGLLAEIARYRLEKEKANDTP